MPATFDNSSSVSEAASVGPDWSHTNTAGNMLIMFIGGWDGTGRTVTATYAGTSMTEIADTTLSNGNDRVWGFRLANPATGANTIATTISGGSMHIIAGAVSVAGAHTTDFSTAVTDASLVNGTSASVLVTGTVNGLIVDGLASGNNDTHAVNGPASHTERWDLSLSAQGEAGTGGTSTGTASEQTIGWTISQSASWAMAAVNVKESAAANPTRPQRPMPMI